jgi:hypothetical protein
VQGNYIGADVLGINAIANARDGIYLMLGCDNNTIGGTDVSQGNLISGNAQFGIDIDSANCTIDWNYIGLDVNGMNLGNGSDWRGGNNIAGNTWGINNQHQ